MFAADQAPFVIDAVSIVIQGRRKEDRDRTISLAEAHQTIVGYVGPDQIFSGGEIGRPLGPAASRVELFQVYIAEDQPVETLVDKLDGRRKHSSPRLLIWLYAAQPRQS